MVLCRVQKQEKCHGEKEQYCQYQISFYLLFFHDAKIKKTVQLTALYNVFNYCLKIKFDKTGRINFFNIAAFLQEDKNQIQNQENGGPNDHSPQRGGFVPHVHEIPSDIVGFDDGQNDENPIKYLHSQNVTHKDLRLIDTEDDLNSGYNGEENKYSPYFLGI